MARSWISLALLALVVAGLATWLYVRPGKPDESHAISEMKAADVKRIRLERATSAAPEAQKSDKAETEPRAEAVTIDLERDGDAWRMIMPLRVRAEALQVERLLAVLDARSVGRYPAKDLEKYGLEPPQLKVTLNDQVFVHGGVNTMTREQYVLSGDFVYAIPLALRTAIPRDVDTLISRALFAPNETPVRFELPEFSAEQSDGAWNFKGVSEDPGPDERNAWVTAWRHATAVKASRHDGRAPTGKIRVKLYDGRDVELGILESDGEVVIVRQDEGIQYHFFADVGKRLLSPPGARLARETK